MAIRMSGLMSGMDTEAIVGALMSAQSLKKTKVEQSKTKLEWKQTKWADLNTKLYKLYTEQVSKMQLQSSYMTKKTSVSDESIAKVTANSKSANGSYTMEVRNIATSQYLTGGKISATSTSEKLTSIDPSLLNKEITVKNGDKEVQFTVTDDMTIADFTSKLQGAGLNANYDTTQKRFFISSKESGLDNAFSITTNGVSDAEVSGRNALREAVGYSGMSSANKAVVDGAMEALEISGVGTEAYNKALDDIAKAVADTKTAAANEAASTYMKAKLYGDNYDSYKTAAEESLKTSYYAEDGTVKEDVAKTYGDKFDAYTDEEKEKLGVQDMSKEEYIEWQAEQDFKAAVDKKADKDTTSFVNKQISDDADVKTELEAAAFAGKTTDDIMALDERALAKYYNYGNDTNTESIEGFVGTSSYDQDSIKNDISAAVSDYASITDRNFALSSSALSGLGLADISVAADGTVSVNGGANNSSNTSIPEGMALVAASDSKIILNGAELTSSSSVVSANGLSIDLVGMTKDGEKITFSVSNDVDAVYDSIKTFVKEYNAIMKEMNELYKAAPAKGYEPLTKEEKEAMTDDDVKLWEDKIKGSLLRSDTTLGGIISGMRNAMMTTVSYEGKSYSLASFGIMTSKDYTEGGLYHIYGDTEDAVYADKTDKLRTALENDPDAVVNVFTGIMANLKDTMQSKMSASKVSSALTFYNDIKMKNDLKDYEEEIEKWEDRLADMEDSYYKKFTAMESAMAKLQAQQGSLGNLFGGY